MLLLPIFANFVGFPSCYTKPPLHLVKRENQVKLRNAVVPPSSAFDLSGTRFQRMMRCSEISASSLELFMLDSELLCVNVNGCLLPVEDDCDIC